MTGLFRLVAYIGLVLLAAPLVANLYADLCARLVIRLRCSPWIGFGLLTVGVLGLLAGLAWLGWTIIS